MTSGVRESPEADVAAARADRATATVATAGGLDAVRAAAGNRGFGTYVRTLARRSVTVGLAAPPAPPPINATERATIPNRRLAALIDEIDKLSSAEVIERRRSEVLAAEAVSGPDAESHQLALEASEYVAGHRRLESLGPYYTVDTPTNRRRNVRVALEEGVREHHSFKKAFAQLPEISDSADARRFFEHEEQAFRTEFSRQARATALAMLDASQREMERVLSGYGLPVQAAIFSADRIPRGADVDTEAAALVKRAPQAADIDTEAHTHRRYDLAQTVGRLKRQQALVAKLDHEAGRAALDVPFNATGPKADAMMSKKAEAEAEVLKLREMWIEAERSHPIITAYRHGGPVDKVDLGALDTDTVEGEMHAVLAKLLPKLGDLLEAKHKISLGEKYLSALSIPSVVAMTKANMFIPRGSIRDGIANDLADEAGTESKWIILGAILLAIVTFLPSGGTSLGIAAGMASVGMAAYSAMHDWEQYSKQKMLSDTDLDIARSLSSEEPSLTPFIVSLVSLGLEPLALLSAFNKARRIKALANSGEDASALINELNQINAKGGKKLEEALDELEAEQQTTKAAKGAAPKILKLKDTPLGFLNKADARARALERLTATRGAMPKRWDMVRTALKDTDGDVNRRLLGLLDRQMGALRDADAWADVIADTWEIAARMRKPNFREALLKLAKRRGIETAKVPGIMKGTRFFDEFVVSGKGLIDPGLAVGTEGVQLHGELTHLMQDLVVDSKLGAGASASFRKLLADAEGTIWRYVPGKPGVLSRYGAYDGYVNRAYNATFLPEENVMKTGDYVWRFTYDLFYLDPSLRRMPQPEAMAPLLEDLFGLK